MSVLVTGGTGFIGLAVAEALAGLGREVVLFAPDPVPAAFAKAAPLREMRHIAGDVRSTDDLAAAFDGSIREVVHLAALTPGREREIAEPRSIFDVNVGGTIAVVGAAAAQGGIRRLVVLSSVAVYGDTAPAADGRLHEEGSPPRPQSLYGISKLALEQAALRLGELYGIDVRAVRLGPAFGPWEHASGARDVLSPHAQCHAHFARGAEAVLPRPMRADWLYSRDAGAGIAALLTAGLGDERVFNLGGGTLSDVPQWCTALAAIRSAPGWRLAGPDAPANVVIGIPRDRPALDNTRFELATGASSVRTLASAAADYTAWRDALGLG